jgi:hypothetical protein
MKSPVGALASCVTALLLGLPLAAQTPSILEPKAERHQGPPLWISAEAVADEKKIINLDLVGSDPLRRRVERQHQALGSQLIEKSRTGEKPGIVKISPSECKSESYLEDYRAGEGPSATLKELANQSKSIVLGIIRNVDFGFSFGSPSSLLSIEVSEVVKGPVPKSLLYIDYPVARFKIGPYQFCNATKGFEPRPGDSILLFDLAGPVDRSDVLYIPRVDQVFFQSRSEGLFLPPLLKNTPDLSSAGSLSDVVQRLRSAGLVPSQGGAR